MTDAEIKQRMWSNTVSNYICIAFRLVLGMVMFRLLIQMLSLEEFGFWGLLWSIFGFGVLLDFGFGFTAQKRVAELSVHKKWDELSRVLSTIFFTYVALGLFIMFCGLILTPHVIDLIQISPENRRPFQELLLLFFLGIGLAFPLGLFPEMLRGLQRISLANYILLGGMIINFILAALILYQGWGLKLLFIVALVCTFGPDLICGFFALRYLPEVRIRPRYFSRNMIRKTVSFSFYAYAITVSNIILTRTDHLVISTGLAVSAVAIYLAGAKIAEMFFAFTQQFPETLSPVAAHHHAKGDRELLRELLVNGIRFSLMVATPLYFICMLYMEGLLRLLTGFPEPAFEIILVGQILLLWSYNMVITQSVSKRIFVMCGHEKKLMLVGVGEAAVNLGLSVGLILVFQTVWVVALSSLIATCIFGWLILWPWAAREANLSGWMLARVVLFPAWFACLPLIGFALALYLLPGLGLGGSLWWLAVQGMIALILGAYGVWRLGLNADEREKLLANIGSSFLKRKAA